MGKNWPLGFPLVLFYFMPSLLFVFISLMLFGAGC